MAGRLEVEGAEGDSLRGDVQRAAEGKFAGAAAESFFGGDFGDIRVVVLLGDVRKDNIARACVETSGSARNSLTMLFDRCPCGS